MYFSYAMITIYSTVLPEKNGSDATVEHPVNTEHPPANQSDLLLESTSSLPMVNQLQSDVIPEIVSTEFRRITLKNIVVISLIGMVTVALFLLSGTFFFTKKRASKNPKAI